MRRTQAITAVTALLGGLLLLLAPAAPAQTSGAGGCASLSGTQDVGSVTIGQTFRLQVAPTCVFRAGVTLTVTVNGVSIPGKVANASGATIVTITVVSATQLSVDDPVLVAARCGVNTVTARGPSDVANGQDVTQTANFTLVCPTATPATPVQGRLSLTGANVARMVAGALALVMMGSLFVVATRRRTSIRV
jgi:hypothetical protein